jgi:Fuc2NAc and GlcNAc transferase
MPALTVAGLYLAPGWLTNLVAAIYMVWLLNLYNFMDGIDGIASIEAITVCLGGVLIYLITIPGSNHWVVPALLLVSVAGFLYWNYPPARIFLGDAGSGFLGITLAVFSIQAASVRSELFWGWAILLGTFIVDATVTLIRRAFRGRKLYQPHRSHAYQYAARSLGSHRSVSLIVGAINLVWLLPVAALVATGRLSGEFGLLVTYLPLVLLALHYRAGVDEATDRASL